MRESSPNAGEDFRGIGVDGGFYGRLSVNGA